MRRSRTDSEPAKLACALGHPHRREILPHISQGEHSVERIA
jgi:hypothetical protein